MARPKSDERIRFKAFVQQVDRGCQEWQSTLHRDGYGKFYFRGKQMMAHRVSYLLFRGEDISNQLVLHTCDNRKCVNPEHLYLGTSKNNAQDREDRNRRDRRRVYPDWLIEACRSLWKSGMTQTDMSRQLGIRQSTISRFIRGEKGK